jgi:hypothetical protein
MMTFIRSLTPSRIGALALAAAVAIIGCALVWLATVGPLLSRDSAIADLRKEVETLEKQRARLGDLERWHAAREAALATRSDFLQKTGGASPAALIQGVMRKAANDSGLSVVSAQDFSPGNADQPAAGVRMNVVGDLNAITEFLLGLSAAKPHLLVDDLAIRKQSGEGADTAYSVTVAAIAFYWAEKGPS